MKPKTVAPVESVAADSGIHRAFAEHYAALVVLAARVSGSRQVAEDLVQDAFLALYRVGADEDVREPGAWLRTAVVRRALNHARHEAHGREVVRTLTITIADATPDSLDGSAVDVERALLTLPPRQRAILLLASRYELRSAEIASIVGCSPATVRVHLHRARRTVGNALTYDRTGIAAGSLDPDQSSEGGTSA